MSVINLKEERQLVVYLSRVTFSGDIIEKIYILISGQINWLEVLEYSIINKVTGLVFYNIERLGLGSKVHLLVYQVLKFYYIGTQERNKIHLDELAKIKSGFFAEGIDCLPLKGAFLLGELYKDIGSRSINDLDLMINSEQVGMAIRKIEALGYVPGDFDRSKKEVIRYSREKEITWKLKMNNLPSYIKSYNSAHVDFIAVDFAITLDLEKNIKVTKQMVKESVKGYLMPAHFFIHLCCHLYKEATGAIWVYLDSDLNLIKFCDVREFILNFMSQEDVTEAIDFINKNNITKPIYYTLYFLKEVYNDGYENELMNRIHIDDKEFLEHFGKMDFGENVKWNKSFWDRMFSYSNKEALDSQQEFVKSYEEYINL